MTIHIFFSIFAFIFCGLLSGLVIFNSKNRTVQRKIFSLVTFFIGVWCLFPFLLNLAQTKTTAFFYAKLVYAFAVFVPSLFFHFIVISTGFIGRKVEQRILRASYFLSFLFLGFLTTPFFISDVNYLTDAKIVPGAVYSVFILYFTFMYIWGTHCFISAYRSQRAVARERLKYIGLAFALAFPSGLIHFASSYGLKEIFPHDFLVITYSSIMAYAIVKHRLMDIRIVLTRAGIFLFVYTLVLGLPFWVGLQTQSWLASTIFMFILATAGPLIYRFFQKKAENLLLAQQKRYQKVLLQAAGGMTREHRLDKLLKLMVYVIKRIVRIEFAAIFLEDKENKCYRLKAIRDYQDVSKNFTFGNRHPLINLLKKKRAILVYEEVKPYTKEFTKKSTHLVVPSFIDNRLIGFLVLGAKDNRTLYTEDDINVFRIISHQAALAIENCLFFEEFKKAQEKIFVAEKLASIGGMADGVAHQVKNRLNHFSIAAGEIQYEIKQFSCENSDYVEQNERLKQTFDYLTQLAGSLVQNVKRTDGIIKGILNYARTSEKDTFFSEFSLREIIELALELLMVKHEIAQFPLEVEIVSHDTVYGVKAQIMEALYNILDNGYEAILEKRTHLIANESDKCKFKPCINLKLTQKPTFSLIEIEDNGMGIKEEDRHKIFAPFFTTKSSYKSGTGIGMYVVKRMIEENHKGRVWFRSEHQEGTGFYIKLPKK
jgi:signal transduction histidine kinase